MKAAKEKLALFTLALLLALSPIELPHLHIESEPIIPSVLSVSMYTDASPRTFTNTSAL